MTFETIIQLLNELLIKTVDAEQGYQHAAGKSDHNSGLYDFLKSKSEQRQMFARDISEMITSLGGTPDTRACFNTTAHEAWDRLRSLNGERELVFAECRQGEKAAIQIYDGHLSSNNLPPIVAALISNQRADITRSLAQIEKCQVSPKNLNDARMSTFIHLV